MPSNYFTPRALNGLNRIGDIFLPHNGEFPSFSELGAGDCVDDLLAFAPRDEVALLEKVLVVFSILPENWLRKLADGMETSSSNEGPLGALLRQLNLGLRGILFTLYYSDKTGTGYDGACPLDLLGVKLNCVED